MEGFYAGDSRLFSVWTENGLASHFHHSELLSCNEDVESDFLHCYEWTLLHRLLMVSNLSFDSKGVGSERRVKLDITDGSRWKDCTTGTGVATSLERLITLRGYSEYRERMWCAGNRVARMDLQVKDALAHAVVR